MKRTHLFCICFFYIFLTSCKNDIDELVNDNQIRMEHATMSTRSTNSSWDQYTDCKLPSGNKKVLPWAESGVQTTIPDEIRFDTKAKDGWTIIASTVEIIGYPMEIIKTDPGSNYLLLYNTKTGMLKGFYYAETMSGNNCGFWQLETSSPTKLFNFASDFAEPLDGNSPQKILLANITSNGETQGFELGWNCFMLELSYDENSHNEKLNISGFAMNKAKITFKGTYNSKSSGTIVASTGNKSSLIDGVASGIGGSAKQWILDNTGQDENKPIKYKGIIGAITADKGITGLITSGLYKVFGSFLGSSKTSSDLNFSTNGTVTIEGELTNPSSGIISSIKGLSLGTTDMKLGIWNLTTKPYFQISSTGKLKSTNSNIYGQPVFTYEIPRRITNVYIQQNPTYQGTLSYTEEAVIYQKYKEQLDLSENIEPHITKIIYEYTPESILYKDDQTEITTCSDNLTGSCELWPNYSTNTNPSVPAARFEGSGYNLTRNSFIKILVTLKDDNDTHYSSKTFWPRQSYYNGEAHPRSWSTEQLKALGFYF